MKDINYLEINKEFDGQLMRLNAEQHQQLKGIIEKDAQFLKNHGLMDYSLLLAIELVKITSINKQPSFSPSINTNMEMI